MRRVLVLGGTAWLGRQISTLLVEAGDDVTCLARGRAGAAAEGARFVAADRSTPGAFDALAGDWDEVVELAYAAEVVGPTVAALAQRAAHWTLISTVSVYARGDDPDADESAAVVQPDDLTQYDQAKVAAERTTVAALGPRLLIVRPGLISGPGDPSDRFGYWPMRLAVGGAVLTPEPDGRRVQVIDVADLAAFVVHAGRERVTGVINAVGHSVPMTDFLAQTASATDFRGRLVPASDEWLLEQDVHYWMGPRSLPLWLPTSEVGAARRSNAAYLAAGGRVRSMADTIQRALEYERASGLDRPRRSGLSPDDEVQLLGRLG